MSHAGGRVCQDGAHYGAQIEQIRQAFLNIFIILLHMKKIVLINSSFPVVEEAGLFHCPGLRSLVSFLKLHSHIPEVTGTIPVSPTA